MPGSSHQPTGFVVWITGIPASGKTTLAQGLQRALKSLDREVLLLDGDEIRRAVSADLGFSRTDRDENVRRVADLAAKAASRGRVAVVAMVSPFAAARVAARRRVEVGRFVEVHCACMPSVAAGRDPKGLYERAQKGELNGLTGVDAPYEPPVKPEVVVCTDKLDAEACLDRAQLALEKMGLLVRRG
jgi:adenylyl-sulfate kinase